ncbi:hypothetical protein [Absidia glauca]|uniref:Ndc10 domain-containing protein n=1 Tax=Absidia glauca TaxID=4829 RepID=A0A168RJA0_ABSGL|nr:hypothetical protein [Absidia glauca]
MAGDSRMILLFSSGIDWQDSFFSWYQVQQEDEYQLRLISSYGGYRVCERGSNTTPWPMEQHNEKLSPDNNDPIQLTVAANAFVQVIMILRKTFYARLGVHDGTPPLPSHLATFNLL